MTLWPIDVWGTEFALVPLINNVINQYQVVANTDGTVIDVNRQKYQMNSGQYLMINSRNAAILKSNSPIELIQFGDYVC